MLTSDGVTLSTQFDKLPNSISFKTFKGQFLNSFFDLQGDVRLKNNQKPDIAVQGDLTLVTEDLLQKPFNLSEKLSSLNPKGTIIFNGLIKGPLEDWRQMSINIKGASPQLSLAQINLDNLNLTYEQQEQLIPNFEVTGNIYDGSLTLSSSATLSDEKMPFQANLTVDSLNLATFKNAKRFKNELGGKLTTSTNLEGSLLNWRKMKGAGTLAIREGLLWQWKILEGLLSALLIPELQEVVFTEASAEYYIDNERINTKNLTLSSDSIDLNAQGWVDFNGTIDMNVLPKFSEITLIQSESLKKASTSFLTNAVSIKLAGTVQKPTYKVDSSPLKVLGTTTDLIKEGVKGVLDELF
jgi:hypothetical protein